MFFFVGVSTPCRNLDVSSDSISGRLKHSRIKHKAYTHTPHRTRKPTQLFAAAAAVCPVRRFFVLCVYAADLFSCVFAMFNMQSSAYAPFFFSCVVCDVDDSVALWMSERKHRSDAK